jgi:hypothetical protein
MKLLTFLGIADYKETTYCLHEQRYQTYYCPAALAHFCRPDTTLVVVTQAAREKHFEALADEIGGITQPRAVLIPDGHSEADLWKIFEALTQQVVAGDELVVDITNGFRSLPFLSFLAITFLQLARKVEVRQVYYGAYEARNQASNETPIFDLTPFMILLDWTIATDRFTRFGDATDLAGLLSRGIPPGPLMGSNLTARALGQALNQAAMAMQGVSLALRLTRPLETMTASQRLVEVLPQVGPLVAEEARPFALLAQQVQQTYTPLALAEPLEREEWPLNLQIQLELIGWYLDKEQYVQAVTLAREWVISLLLFHFGGDSLIDYGQGREPIENALNNAVERQRPKPRPARPTPYDGPLQALPVQAELGKIWSKLTTLRNDIAHVGMNLNPKPAQKLRNEARALYPALQSLGQALGKK